MQMCQLLKHKTVIDIFEMIDSGSTQRHYIVGGVRKDRKTRKSSSEEKVMGFCSASLFPARKREAVTQGGTRRIDHLTGRKTQGAGIAKGWEDKRDRGRIPDTFT